MTDLNYVRDLSETGVAAANVRRDQATAWFLALLCGATGVPGTTGPGRCVCPWAAARPRAVRAASFARRVGSKPGQALPPPTGTAAGPSTADRSWLCIS